MKNSQTKKFIPTEKLSKKAKKEIEKAKRGTWFGIKPVTRVIQSSKKKKLNFASSSYLRCQKSSYN